jgi:hypothetical protein
LGGKPNRLRSFVTSPPQSLQQSATIGREGTVLQYRISCLRVIPMSLLTSDTATERATLPAAGPFAPARVEARGGSDVTRAVLTSMLALYPVLAAVAVALVSLSVSGA